MNVYAAYVGEGRSGSHHNRSVIRPSRAYDEQKCPEVVIALKGSLAPDAGHLKGPKRFCHPMPRNLLPRGSWKGTRKWVIKAVQTGNQG